MSLNLLVKKLVYPDWGNHYVTQAVKYMDTIKHIKKFFRCGTEIELKLCIAIGINVPTMFMNPFDSGFDLGVIASATAFLPMCTLGTRMLSCRLNAAKIKVHF